MNKIKFVANKDTNFIFHMLSVAKCGYDNAYGNCYRALYPEADLNLLKENEPLLTVCGGEHCGALYETLVVAPARGYVSAKEYYKQLLIAIDNDAVPEELKEYSDIVYRISEMMIRHYDDYVKTIWEKEKRQIEDYIPKVNAFFEKSQFTEKAETIVGCKLWKEFFIATLVSSVENGAEAIDISDEQDVFGIVRDPYDAFYFMGHEFIIYLLFHALKNEDAFKSLETWCITEGLAEYYLKKIMGDTRFFEAQQKYVEFFEECEKEQNYTAVELYEKAYKTILHGF